MRGGDVVAGFARQLAARMGSAMLLQHDELGADPPRLPNV